MGACMLFEDTPDHRTLFGEEVTRAAGFRTPEELAELARRYCADAELRAGLRKQLRAAVVGGANTYRDRLESMLRPANG